MKLIQHFGDSLLVSHFETWQVQRSTEVVLVGI